MREVFVCTNLRPFQYASYGDICFGVPPSHQDSRYARDNAVQWPEDAQEPIILDHDILGKLRKNLVASTVHGQRCHRRDNVDAGSQSATLI